MSMLLHENEYAKLIISYYTTNIKIRKTKKNKTKLN